MKLNLFFAAAIIAYASSLVVAIPINSDFEAREYDSDDLITREEAVLEVRELPIVVDSIDAREFDDEELEVREIFDDEDFEAREIDEEDLEAREPQGRGRGGWKRRGRRGAGRMQSEEGGAPPPSE